MRLRAGDRAPDFSAPNQHSEKIKLSDFLGKRIVLYFYPKDMTPGCTTEACEFSEASKAIAGKNGIVIGVSPDGVDSHKKFIAKHKLDIMLVADTDKKICNAYGVWQKKQFMGKEYMGVVRTTFLIDDRGHIEKIYEKVKPEGHAKEVLASI